MLKQLIFLCIFLVDVSGKNEMQAMQLSQWPRFVGMKTGDNVALQCKNSGGRSLTNVQWLMAPPASKSGKMVKEGGRIHFGQYSIILTKLEPDDSGVYFCLVNGTHGPGSEVQVHRRRDLESAIKRSNMKDVIIFLQGFLLAIFLIIQKLCYKQQAENEESIYEEPDEDHTYEGLDIEQCGLYEDIPAFSHQDADADADADVDADADAKLCDMESPDQE